MKTLSFVALASTLAMGAAVHAADNRFDLGVANVRMHSRADDISGRFVPAGVNLSVGDATTLFVAYTRVLSDHFEAQLSGGWPPTYETRGKGVASLGSLPWAGQKVGTAKEIAPSAFINYSFAGRQALWQPYLGLGVNYTHFADVKSTAANDAANGGPTSVALTNSHGMAAKIGLRYRLDPRWSFNVHLSTARVSSRLTTNTAGIMRTTQIDFRPQVLVLSGGYAF